MVHRLCSAQITRQTARIGSDAVEVQIVDLAAKHSDAGTGRQTTLYSSCAQAPFECLIDENTAGKWPLGSMKFEAREQWAVVKLHELRARRDMRAPHDIRNLMFHFARPTRRSRLRKRSSDRIESNAGSIAISVIAIWRSV